MHSYKRADASEENRKKPQCRLGNTPCAPASKVLINYEDQQCQNAHYCHCDNIKARHSQFSESAVQIHLNFSSRLFIENLGETFTRGADILACDFFVADKRVCIDDKMTEMRIVKRAAYKRLAR